MAKVLLFIFDLAGTGKTKALRRAFFCLHFRYNTFLLLSYFLDLGLNTMDMNRPSIAGGLSIT
jgi:hypothetical protein